MGDRPTRLYPLPVISPGPAQATAPSLAAARLRGRIIAAVGLALILAIAVLRQVIAPSLRLPFGAQFLEATAVSGSASPSFSKPAIMFAKLVTELVALTVFSRTLERRRVSVPTIAIATAGLGMGVMLAFSLVQCALEGAGPSRLVGAFLGGPLGGLEVYGLWILAFRYPQLLDDARLRALEMERTRQAAEISHLREHLQPHFLRNSLNAIAALVTEDPSEARNLLGALGDLLSDSIESSAPLRPLGEELAWLRRYAEILEARYRGALSFAWDEGPSTGGALVPRLLLQPLVENAVNHGALARDGGGRVTVRTRARAGGGTRVEVEDNGPGFDRAGPPREGLGLRLVRCRVEMESRGTFRLERSPGGTCAVVELP
jgi:signal transduction histidine kinase